MGCEDDRLDSSGGIYSKERLEARGKDKGTRMFMLVEIDAATECEQTR